MSQIITGTNSWLRLVNKRPECYLKYLLCISFDDRQLSRCCTGMYREACPTNSTHVSDHHLVLTPGSAQFILNIQIKLNTQLKILLASSPNYRSARKCRMLHSTDTGEDENCQHIPLKGAVSSTYCVIEQQVSRPQPHEIIPTFIHTSSNTS